MNNRVATKDVFSPLRQTICIATGLGWGGGGTHWPNDISFKKEIKASVIIPSKEPMANGPSGQITQSKNCRRNVNTKPAGLKEIKRRPTDTSCERKDGHKESCKKQ